MRLSWRDRGKPRADKAHGKTVEVTGFPVTILPTPTVDHFLMMAARGCCGGCGPNNPLAVLEVIAAFEHACGRRLAKVMSPRRPGDVAAYYADANRASAVIGWKATRDLAAICADAWRWQKNGGRY